MKPTSEISRFPQAGKSTRTFARNLAGAIALFGAVGMTQAGVVDPTQKVAGIATQLELAEQWVQWALSTDAASNPMLDTTGAYAHVNNLGPVFFVAGNTGGSSTRTFTVPAGKPIFFPIINAFDLEVPADNCDVQCAFGFIPGVGGATGLYATLDGQDLLLTFPSYRQTSTAFFKVNLSASLRDALGFPSQYVGVLDAITDGYWVAVEGLTPGPHTLKFGGTFPELAPGWTPFSLDVTDTVNVPEPGTLGLLLLGGVAAYARRRSSVATDAVSVRT